MLGLDPSRDVSSLKSPYNITLDKKLPSASEHVVIGINSVSSSNEGHPFRRLVMFSY